MTDKNAEKRRLVMEAEAAVTKAYSDLKLTPEYTAYAAAELALQASPAFKEHARLEEEMYELYAEHGEPQHCEGCGVPLFEGDVYGCDMNGIFSCREDGPCYDPIKAA